MSGTGPEPIAVQFPGERAGSPLAQAVHIAVSTGVVAVVSSSAQAVVVGADDPDPVATIEGALHARCHVLVESTSALGMSAIDALSARRAAAGVGLWAALPSRFEETFGWLCDRVRSGTLGLTWGAFAEAAWVDGRAPLDVAVDLVDAIEQATALRVVACDTMTNDRALVASLQLNHGAIGLVSAAPRQPDDGAIDASVTLRVTGTHGTAVADLAGPVLRLSRPTGPTRSARLGSGGWARMVASFASAARGDIDHHELADLTSAGRCAALLLASASEDPAGGRFNDIEGASCGS